jgi:TolB-like protein
MTKKYRLFPLALIFTALAACQSLDSNPVILERGIKDIARHIEENLAPGTKVAILNFTSPTERLSNYIIEMLMVELVETKKLKVVDRQDLDDIRMELDFQMSGEVADNEQQAAGKMLGAESVISGSLMDLGTALRFTFKVLNVQSAEVEALRVMNVPHNEQIDFLLIPTAAEAGLNTGGQGTSSNDAIVVPLNSGWEGSSLAPDQGERWFRVTIQNPGTYAFETDGGLDTIMEIYDGPTMARLGDDDDSGGGENAKIVFQGDGGRAYLFKVRGYNPDTTGPFRYRASTVGGSRP